MRTYAGSTMNDAAPSAPERNPGKKYVTPFFFVFLPDDLQHLFLDPRERVGVSGLDIEAKKRFGVGRPQVEAPVFAFH